MRAAELKSCALLDYLVLSLREHVWKMMERIVIVEVNVFPSFALMMALGKGNAGQLGLAIFTGEVAVAPM